MACAIVNAQKKKHSVPNASRNGQFNKHVIMSGVKSDDQIKSGDLKCLSHNMAKKKNNIYIFLN